MLVWLAFVSILATSLETAAVVDAEGGALPLNNASSKFVLEEENLLEENIARGSKPRENFHKIREAGRKMHKALDKVENKVEKGLGKIAKDLEHNADNINEDIEKMTRLVYANSWAYLRARGDNHTRSNRSHLHLGWNRSHSNRTRKLKAALERVEASAKEDVVSSARRLVYIWVVSSFGLVFPLIAVIVNSLKQSTDGVMDWQSIFCVFAYLAGCIAVVFANRWVTNPKRFPFPVALMGLHFGMTACISFVVVSFSQTTGVNTIMNKPKLIVTHLMPVGMAMGGAAALSNLANLQVVVHIFHVIRPLRLLCCYIACIVLGREVFAKRQVGILTFVSLAASGAAYNFFGENEWTTLGVGTCILFCVARGSQVALIDTTLSLSIDPWTLLLIASPCALKVLICMQVTMIGWNPQIPGKFYKHWPYLLGSGLIGVVINWSTVNIIQKFGPLVFILVSFLKDFTFVVFGYVFMQAPLTTNQAFMYTLVIFGSIVYVVYVNNRELAEKEGIFPAMTMIANDQIGKFRSKSAKIRDHSEPDDL